MATGKKSTPPQKKPLAKRVKVVYDLNKLDKLVVALREIREIAKKVESLQWFATYDYRRKNHKANKDKVMREVLNLILHLEDVQEWMRVEECKKLEAAEEAYDDEW
jgi:hypothetical protein